MKNHPFLKSLYWSFLIGFSGVAATAGSVQAADIGMPVLETSQVQVSAKSTSITLENSATPSKGAQGPTRTEEFSDPKPKVDSEMVRRDLESQRYPMSNNVGIP
jgi:hypothetical protein